MLQPSLLTSLLISMERSAVREARAGSASRWKAARRVPRNGRRSRADRAPRPAQSRTAGGLQAVERVDFRHTGSVLCTASAAPGPQGATHMGWRGWGLEGLPLLHPQRSILTLLTHVPVCCASKERGTAGGGGPARGHRPAHQNQRGTHNGTLDTSKAHSRGSCTARRTTQCRRGAASAPEFRQCPALPDNPIPHQSEAARSCWRPASAAGFWQHAPHSQRSR